MATVSVQTGYIPNVVETGADMCEARKSITVQIDFNLGLTYQLDLSAVQAQQQWIRSVQALYVDNSANNTPMVITMGVTLQRIVIPRNSCAYVPVLQPNPPVLQIQSTSAVTLKLHILNFFLPPAVWSANGAAFTFTAGGAVIVSDPALEALIINGALQVNAAPYNLPAITDRSGTITVGGTRQALFALNAARKRWIIENPSTATEVLQFSFTTNATGLLTLTAGETWDESGSSIVGAAVFIVAATAGHAFAAYEG